jgi:hypothetical protein
MIDKKFLEYDINEVKKFVTKKVREEKIKNNESDDIILDIFLNDFGRLIELITKELFQKFVDHNLVPPNIKKLLPFNSFGQIIIREDKKFSINPHLHRKKEIMDCLYYFPNTDVDITQGTVVYKKISEEVKVGDRTSYENFDYKYFEEVKKFDYTPNKVIVWLNNNKSFHGANPVAQSLKENKKYVFLGCSV